MRQVTQFIGLLFVCLSATNAHGVGDVIGVSVANGKLIVDNGVLDNFGYADRLFFEDDADGFPVQATVQGFGPSFVWGVPGLNITGMTENSGLYLQTVVRPVKYANPPKERVLWYWNSATQTIVDVPSANHFLIYKGPNSPLTPPQNTFITGTDSAAPDALKIAAPLSSEMGVDNYGGFVRFALHRQTPPPAGAYGFFAQLTSDQYAPSDPFLVLFNVGQLTGPQMVAAALTVNAVAAEELAGDYNGNGTVDAADFTVWRDNFNTEAILPNDVTPGWVMEDDYDVWKNNFGATVSGAGGLAIVPEPAALSLVVAGLLAALNTKVRRKSGAKCRFTPNFN